ncbi:bifunctional (p)ppGpp synthetase/guanosine-3',5'-bis(diphosphate) 3'-pyrophosphohydrolase, partial [Bacillus pseudomycoides]|uniref:HD domain-containing protein n=1 Tax=Bacillus pseudomycoides TaxID=64104 RepID=UPI0028494CB3
VLTAEQLLAKASQYLADDDLELVARAYEYARDAHSEQYRKSGVPYIIHPIQVAGSLVDLHIDPSTVSAGFVHYVVDDTE